jgi:glycosyltransferase involved in cell wall biosynthesis
VQLSSRSGPIVTTFLGQLGHCPLLGSVYATADAFFSPSTCETLGQVFQEAMASGTVPVGCNLGGVPEVFDHGVEGYLFEEGQLVSAAQGIVAALGDRAAALAAAGQRSACSLPPALAAAGDSGKAALARHRVVSKSWACAYEQVESAYFRALATRWPYRVNTRGLK